MSRRAIALGLLWLATAAALWAVPVLTDEDVVRMLVSGVPEAEIVRRIEAARVEFDLSDEMVDELSLAGVSPQLLEAMRRRQTELHPEAHPPEPPAEPEPAAGALLRIRLDVRGSGSSGRRVLRLRDVIDPATAEVLKLREERRFSDLAVVLACLTADHVPDHWRSQSPLGRDFVSMPRHRVLAFIAGAAREEKGRSRDGEATAILSLEIPAVIEAAVEPGVAHDLLLGLAARAGERYLLLRSDRRSGVIPDEGVTELRATLGGGKPMSPAMLSVRFTDDATEAPPAAGH